MSGEHLLVCFGEINDKFIKEAAPKTHSLYKPWWGLAAVAAVIVLVTCFLSTYHNEPDEISDPPNIIFLHGEYYIDSGHWVFSLPDDAVLLGEVNNVSKEKAFPNTSLKDFDGTRDGYIYMCPEDDDVIYFQHKTWNESVAGKEKYIILIRDDKTRDVHIYICPEEDYAIHLQNKLRNESVDGKEKYIILMLDKEE